MDDDKVFDYDVAFSFNAMDEAVVTQINDLISDRFKTFLYSERQRELAGRDGQEKFSEVFGRTSRIVIIFYRPEWGETPWTRVEKEAIRTRAFDEGWDFTTFIPTIVPRELPPWLPKTRLYVGLERFGVTGAVGVIESRISERGGQPKLETVVDRAKRFTREIEFKKQKQLFEHSESGVISAKNSYLVFETETDKICKNISNSSINLSLARHGAYVVIRGLPKVNAVCHFEPYYSNVVEGVELSIEYFLGFPKLPGIMSWNEAKILKRLRYKYELIREGYSGWVGIDENRREFNSILLAEHTVKTYLDISQTRQ